MTDLSFTAFGREFSERVRPWEDSLRSLEREGCTYEDWMLDEERGGPGIYRVDFSPAEIYQYVRAIAGWDEYLAGGFEAVSDRELAREAASSAEIRQAHDPVVVDVCPADFLGDALETAVCGMEPGRAQRVHPSGSTRDAHATVHDIASSLPTAVKALTERGKNQAFEMRSEKDLQDVLYLILRSVFNDARREESTPSAAGNAKRIDIAIPSAGLLLEAKYLRDSAHARRVADELRIDIESYHSHPSCKVLFALVWDPRNLIADPQQIERDLSAKRVKGEASFDVSVRIV